MFDDFHQGHLKRSTAKYDEPLYVKYLTPVEQVKELADFIKRVNDMSTLTKIEEKKDNDEENSEYSADVEQQVKKMNIGN